MINGFQQWATSERLIQSSPVEQFTGRCIAIDADDYIRKLITEGDAKEALLPALGGVPFGLEKALAANIQSFKNAGIKPLFVFNGLVRTGERRKAEIARPLFRTLEASWELYNATPPNPDRAVREFGVATAFDISHIQRYVQSLFHSLRVPFIVAPYSAHAQMVHMEGAEVDAIYGPPELLLFPAERVILDLDFGNKTTTWVVRQNCMNSLTSGNSGMWMDACLLAGCDLLPTLPQIENDVSANAKTPKIKAAADLLRRTSLNGNQLCLQYSEDPAAPGAQYLDDYRKMIMSIAHQIVTDSNGDMVVLNNNSAPGDIHAFMGQRLPDEIYYYVSRGVIGTRVLSWRTSGQVEETPPVDGGKSVTYETLVKGQILPQRVQALRLLSQSLHRFYQHNDVNLRLFFGQEPYQNLAVNEAGDLKSMVAGWHIRQPVIADRMKAVKVQDASLYFALEALTSADFVKSTTSSKMDTAKPLKDVHEVQSNVLWRYLRLRDYVTSSHELSQIGEALQQAYTAAASKGLKKEDFGEALLVGIEMLRLKLLSTENLFPNPPYSGAPYGGSLDDKRYNLLVSRVACLGRLKHKSNGYSGPLSRHLLAYKSLISVVQRSQRDIIDMCLCTMLLDGVVDRQMPEYELMKIGFGLPFVTENDCGLGLAVKTYLDDLANQQDPTSPATREKTKDKGPAWFQLVVDFKKSLEYAFSLFDVMAVAVKAMPTTIVSEAIKKDFAQAEQWLQDRR